MASGEFEEAVVRLNHWYAFLSQSPSKEAQLLKKCIQEAQQFEDLCETHLKEYLPNVATHLEKSRQTHKGKEDYLWVQSQPVVYYLNMVGAEILNTAFRKSFQQTKDRRHSRRQDGRCHPRERCACRPGCGASSTW